MTSPSHAQMLMQRHCHFRQGTWTPAVCELSRSHLTAHDHHALNNNKKLQETIQYISQAIYNHSCLLWKYPSHNSVKYGNTFNYVHLFIVRELLKTSVYFLMVMLPFSFISTFNVCVLNLLQICSENLFFLPCNNNW